MSEKEASSWCFAGNLLVDMSEVNMKTDLVSHY